MITLNFIISFFRKDPSENDYSVYGSPSIDYSKFYSQPPVKITNHNVPLEDGRDDPQLALQVPHLIQLILCGPDKCVKASTFWGGHRFNIKRCTSQSDYMIQE